MRSDRWRVLAGQLAILVAFVAAWEYFTGIKAISRTPGLYWIDSFFISRPSKIAERFLYLASDRVRLSIWAMALSTIQSSLWGFAVGITTGFVAGLVLGRGEHLARVFSPFIVAFNSLSRIALVPLLIHSARFLGATEGQIMRTGLGYLIIQSLGTLNAADMMVALVTLGAIGIAMALAIK